MSSPTDPVTFEAAPDYERALSMDRFAPKPPAFCRRAMADWLSRGSGAVLLLDAVVVPHGGFRFLVDPPSEGNLIGVTAKERFAHVIPDIEAAEAAWLELCGVPASTRYQHARAELTTGASVFVYRAQDLGLVRSTATIVEELW